MYQCINQGKMSRRKRTLAWTVAGTAGLLMLSSGLAKMMGASEAAMSFGRASVISWFAYPGLVEMIFAAIFLLPQTAKVGFLLITCYFTLVISGGLSTEYSLFTSLLILGAVWVATFLRNPEMFLATESTTKSKNK